MKNKTKKKNTNKTNKNLKSNDKIERKIKGKQTSSMWAKPFFKFF